ncbi:polyprenyl synthetase family protein [Candidatus Nucleicultrix amoebiphila]|jgi:octaprenyl-diphosphate synthase|uniref:Farnesyltranstransferase n=1 Tax=Candidatus Nucleicultrix amoebiphila FS5 TaxID=1414854 RepID=A0A1W6N5R0_9PROT|nr:polyprenyl synthetase family protein [Candidatus Nucleicultrix amoebiphila]ARN85106.1 hypothetical protein GQ61_07175 [Candidatus Nucleicultrix amoebiphila FS5]
MTALSQIYEKSNIGSDLLKPLQTLVSSDLERVNAIILDRLKSPIDLIPTLARHLIAAGGKRMRPMLTLACSALVEHNSDRPIRLAAAIEFIHAATLLHDDVVDESELRRGVPTANSVWGNQASILVGDFLFSRAFELMVEDGSLDVLRILSSASSKIAEGEVMQLVSSKDVTTSQNTYLEIATYKTATLFEAACQVGAVLDGPNLENERALASFGRNLGLAFQLVDDVLDYQASSEMIGKNVGDDFKEGKITLPVILAYKKANEDEKKFWQRTLGTKQQNAKDFGQALAYLNKHRALDETLTHAQTYIHYAQESLIKFKPSPYLSALFDLCEFCLKRAF